MCTYVFENSIVFHIAVLGTRENATSDYIGKKNNMRKLGRL